MEHFLFFVGQKIIYWFYFFGQDLLFKGNILVFSKETDFETLNCLPACNGVNAGLPTFNLMGRKFL